MLDGMKKYFVVASIHITPAAEGITRETATETAFDQLVDLVMENDFERVFDPDVTADLAEGRLDLCMGVEGFSQLDVAVRVQSVMEKLRLLHFDLDSDYAVTSKPLVAA